MKSARITFALPVTLHGFKKIAAYTLIAISFPLFFSCTSTKSTTYFSDLSDSLRVQLPEMKRPDAVIMPDDILEIKIAGANEQTSSIFNNYGGSNTPGNAATYLVNSEGDVEFPFIGKEKAAGLTREQFKNKLKQDVNKYLKEPIVSVRFSNFRFTVLGEVRTPGSFVTPNEKVSILEAMGQAGDMTQFARRDAVRIIRDSSGKREIGTINFNQKTIFTSPYYYLQRNDVVYIEPQTSKANYESASRVTSFVATGLGIIAVIFSLLKK